MENLFDIFKKILEKHSDSFANNKDFSISYFYSSDMDKPDMKIDGIELDPEILKSLEEFMHNFEKQYKNHQNSDLLTNNNTFELERKSVETELFYDIFQENNNIIIIIELPAIDKKDIQLHASSNEIEIQTPLHHKLISLPVAVNNEIVKARYTNGILEIHLEINVKKNNKKIVHIN